MTAYHEKIRSLQKDRKSFEKNVGAQKFYGFYKQRNALIYW